MSSLPLLIFLLLLSKSSYSFSPCPINYSFGCGNVTISYPFSPFYDTNSSEYCGLPGLLISCEDSTTPILHLKSENYTVLGIDYDNSTVTLANTDVLHQNTSCPTVRNNVSLFSDSGVTYTSSDVDLTFFFRCNVSSDVVDYTPIACFSGTQNGYSYVFRTGDLNSSQYAKLVKYCPTVVVTPVLEYNLEKINSTGLNTEFGLLLRKGFQLGWNLTDDCAECQNNSGQCGYTMTNDKLSYLFKCYCANGSCDARRHTLTLPVMFAIGLTSFFVLLAIASCIWFLARRNKRNGVQKEELKKKKVVNVNKENLGSLSPKKYTFSEIRKITKSFNQKIGQGGYGSVFKGELMDGTSVAVKVIKDRESSSAEFTSEVVLIAKTSHVNIVRLLGFSMEGSRRALIYELMPNGSLDKYLRECQNLTLSHVICTRLFEIAVGIARGLEYLHRGCNTRIVHFDIKPHNILLDHDYCPRISDFGLAKFCQPKDSIVSMSGMRGTIGYIAPEVFSRNFGVVSSKSDVYSYGMMMLEMFGGNKRNEMELTHSSSDTYFPNHIYTCLEQNNICSAYGIPDACEEIVRKITIVGLWCIQMVPQARPTMSAVLDMFERNIEELALPPPLNVSPPPELILESTDLTVSSISYDQQ